MAELRPWHKLCLTMAMEKSSRFRRLSRLFVIKTRWEAWVVIWAIALGAVSRGKAYLTVYPGALGWLFMLICTGVVFIAGAVLLDATRPASALPKPRSERVPARRRRGAVRRTPSSRPAVKPSWRGGSRSD